MRFKENDLFFIAERKYKTPTRRIFEIYAKLLEEEI